MFLCSRELCYKHCPFQTILLCEQRVRSISSRVGECNCQRQKKKHVITANFKCVLDTKIISKEIGDLETGNELLWDLEVPRYNAFTSTFQFKWASDATELMPCGTHGCASICTKLPRHIGLPSSPGEGKIFMVCLTSEYRFDCLTLETNTKQSL